MSTSDLITNTAEPQRSVEWLTRLLCLLYVNASHMEVARSARRSTLILTSLRSRPEVSPACIRPSTGLMTLVGRHLTREPRAELRLNISYAIRWQGHLGPRDPLGVPFVFPGPENTREARGGSQITPCHGSERMRANPGLTRGKTKAVTSSSLPPTPRRLTHLVRGSIHRTPPTRPSGATDQVFVIYKPSSHRLREGTSDVRTVRGTRSLNPE